ncbi:hypothetical protein HDU97_003987, partial [Phlyctochytrium planicorne]
LTADDYVVQVPFQTQTGKIVNVCVIGFQDVSDSLNYALIGNTFLKRYLSVFDYKTRNIGFSLAKGRQPLPDNAPSITGAGSNNIQAITTSTPSKNSVASANRLGSMAIQPASLSPTRDNSNTSPSTGLIAAASISGIVILVALSVALFTFVKHRKPRSEVQLPDPEVVSDFLVSKSAAL